MRARTELIFLLAMLLLACSAPARLVGQIAPDPTATAAAKPAPASTPTVTPNPLPTTVSSEPAPPAKNRTPETPLIDQYLPRREVAAETEHFTFYVQDGYLPVDLDEWTAQAEDLYGYVSQRLNGAQAEHKIQLAFLPPDERACPVRGLASYSEDAPVVLIYADEQSPRTYLLAVLAHELGHAIPSEGLPGGLPDDLALTEGLATYASGKYWQAWKGVPSLDALVQQYIDAGTYESLRENYDLHGIYPWQRGSASSEDCLARRDKIYSEWGAFTGYLIETYGWGKLLRLYDSPEPLKSDGQVIEFPPDYEGVYGKSLNQLEADWLAALAFTYY